MHGHCYRLLVKTPKGAGGEGGEGDRQNSCVALVLLFFLSPFSLFFPSSFPQGRCNRTHDAMLVFKSKSLSTHLSSTVSVGSSHCALQFTPGKP